MPIRLKRRLECIDQWLKKQKLSLDQLQQKRLIFGLIFFALLVLSQIFKGYYLELIGLFIFLPLFIFYFKKSRINYGFIEDLEKLKSFYLHQQNFQEAKSFSYRNSEPLNHPLARDLDLDELSAGLNFCFSQQGSELFNSWLLQDFKNSTFEQRQSYLKEISQFPGVLRRLHSQEPIKKVNFSLLDKELKRSFLEQNPPWKWIIPISWLALIVSLFLSPPGIVWKTFLFIYLASSLFYMGLSKDLFLRLQDLVTQLESLGLYLKPMLRLSKNLSFTPQLKVATPEKDLKQFSRLVSLVSLKANPIIFYILNAILPWNFVLTEFCERSRKKIQNHFSQWSSEIILIDSLASFANLAIYHDTVWPEQNNKGSIEVESISHPLLDQNKVVKNSFYQGNDKHIFIITGSNMSGKSTFLRALGINFCLARVGAPVFAKKFLFPDIEIHSCIRVNDSLRDGQSYFYAEVQRMKSILEMAKKNPILFLIDEPLRGTNNRERLLGNQSYLKQMLQTASIGFVTTHDLELTQLSNISPQVENYHFSEDWKQKDLYFNYLIQEGPSQSTNALKILEKEGLYT